LLASVPHFIPRFSHDDMNGHEDRAAEEYFFAVTIQIQQLHFIFSTEKRQPGCIGVVSSYRVTPIIMCSTLKL
jgi:hypothetical protein